MSDPPGTKRIDLFLDLLPNQPKNEQTRDSFRASLRQRFEARLPEAVERMWDLPPLMVKPSKTYLELLLEARELFVAGYFYSCVAMCGIVGERLIKDLLRASVLVEKDGQAERPAGVAFDQLEHVEIRGLVQFLRKSSLLDEEAVRAVIDLGVIRNRYAHARGKDARKDAIRAVQLLHTLVEGTVSVFKDHEIKDGVFVRKAPSPSTR